MFVVFKPGSDWLMEYISRKVLSSSHRFLATSVERKYATAPPPKLVAPIIKNAEKISETEARAAGEGDAVFSDVGAVDAVSLMRLRRIALEAVH